MKEQKSAKQAKRAQRKEIKKVRLSIKNYSMTWNLIVDIVHLFHTECCKITERCD